MRGRSSGLKFTSLDVPREKAEALRGPLKFVIEASTRKKHRDSARSLLSKLKWREEDERTNPKIKRIVLTKIEMNVLNAVVQAFPEETRPAEQLSLFKLPDMSVVSRLPTAKLSKVDRPGQKPGVSMPTPIQRDKTTGPRYRSDSELTPAELKERRQAKLKSEKAVDMLSGHRADWESRKVSQQDFVEKQSKSGNLLTEHHDEWERGHQGG